MKILVLGAFWSVSVGLYLGVFKRKILKKKKNFEKKLLNSKFHLPLTYIVIYYFFFCFIVSKQSVPAENTSSRLLEGSSSSHSTIRDSKQDSHPRLEGSSGSQDSKGTLTVDYHTLSAEGSSSTSHDSKDHPFARSKLGTVKKVASGPPKPGIV